MVPAQLAVAPPPLTCYKDTVPSNPPIDTITSSRSICSPSLTSRTKRRPGDLFSRLPMPPPTLKMSVLDILPGDLHTAYSCDTVDPDAAGQDNFVSLSTADLNIIDVSGAPPHHLKLEK